MARQRKKMAKITKQREKQLITRHCMYKYIYMYIHMYSEIYINITILELSYT